MYKKCGTSFFVVSNQYPVLAQNFEGMRPKQLFMLRFMSHCVCVNPPVSAVRLCGTSLFRTLRASLRES
jgi:hypothetical protein